jgi:hypothetical protein
MGTAILSYYGRSLGIVQTNQNDLWAGVKILIVLGWLFIGLASYIKNHSK